MALNQESLERLWQHIIARLGKKVDKEDGKGLSSCDFTEEEKEKLKDLETNVRVDWNETDPTSASYIVNTPTEVENNIIAEWDGVITEDMAPVNGYFYKVSNYNDTDLSKIFGITFYSPQQGEIFIPLDEESLIYTEQDGISVLTDNNFFYVVSAPIEQFSEAGTYLMYSSQQDGYIKALNGKINVVKEKNISKKIARLIDLPCGEIPGGIYWDGDTTNKESVQLEDGTFLYKVSDKFYNIEDLIGKKVRIQMTGYYEEVPILSNYIQSINEDLFTIGNAIIIALKETTLEGAGTFSPGTYFFKEIINENNFQYISYLETDNTIKILDEKYIPDTIARVEDINTAINNITYPITSVNGQTGDVEITAASLGALTSAPVSSVNGNTGDVVLTASDVGALPDTTNIPSIDGLASENYVDTAISNIEIPSIEGLASENYVETKIAELVNSAPETLNTLNELATALGNDPNFATTIAAEIGTKANANDLTSHIDNKSNPHNVTAVQIGAATEEYVNNAISNIPTPDVSGQISTHNTDTAAHNDIREAIANLNTLVGDTSVSTQIESAINALREEILGGAW